MGIPPHTGTGELLHARHTTYCRSWPSRLLWSLCFGRHHHDLICHAGATRSRSELPVRTARRDVGFLAHEHRHADDYSATYRRRHRADLVATHVDDTVGVHGDARPGSH